MKVEIERATIGMMAALPTQPWIKPMINTVLASIVVYSVYQLSESRTHTLPEIIGGAVLFAGGWLMLHFSTVVISNAINKNVSNPLFNHVPHHQPMPHAPHHQPMPGDVPHSINGMSVKRLIATKKEHEDAIKQSNWEIARCEHTIKELQVQYSQALKTVEDLQQRINDTEQHKQLIQKAREQHQAIADQVAEELTKIAEQEETELEERLKHTRAVLEEVRQQRVTPPGSPSRGKGNYHANLNTYHNIKHETVY